MGSVDKFRFSIDRAARSPTSTPRFPGKALRNEAPVFVDPSNYDAAPIEGIRRTLDEFSGEKIPRSSKIPTDRIEWIRMGTTVATNALLERKAERIALCVTRGFRDLLQIGNQEGPNIFDLKVLKPSNLYEEVIEVDDRVELVGDGERLRGMVHWFKGSQGSWSGWRSQLMRKR